MLLLVAGGLELDEFALHVVETGGILIEFEVAEFEEHLETVHHVGAGQALVAILQEIRLVAAGETDRDDPGADLVLADQFDDRVTVAGGIDEEGVGAGRVRCVGGKAL